MKIQLNKRSGVLRETHKYITYNYVKLTHRKQLFNHETLTKTFMVGQAASTMKNVNHVWLNCFQQRLLHSFCLKSFKPTSLAPGIQQFIYCSSIASGQYQNHNIVKITKYKEKI